jgi:hypothetical protein
MGQFCLPAADRWAWADAKYVERSPNLAHAVKRDSMNLCFDVRRIADHYEAQAKWEDARADARD